jgi:hypothetical protein
MVRKIKDKDKSMLKTKQGNCHLNVRNYIDAYGGSSVSGWILNRVTKLIENGIYVWSFHSVWLKPDDKAIDVTDDLYYKGRDKIIFILDSNRVPNLTEGLFYNNFIVIDSIKTARMYSAAIGKDIQTNTPYWCNNALNQFFDLDEHSGVYRSISSVFPNNKQILADEYGVDIVNGKLVARQESNNSNSEFIKKLVFDFSLSN